MVKKRTHRQTLYVRDFWVGALLGILLGIVLGSVVLFSVAFAAEEPEKAADRPEFCGAKPVLYLPEETQEAEQAEMPEEPKEPESIGWYIITAYCPCQSCCGKEPDDPWYGITATGTRAKQGRTIAVDPNVIPYGTVLYFEGMDGMVSGFVAEDCGGAIKGNRIDLYFDSHEDAQEWGVRELEVYR